MNFVEIKEISDYLDRCHHDNGIKIRPGTKSDCKEIARLIQELADFEKMPHGPKIGEEVLEYDGFEHSPPLFRTLVAEDPDDPEHKRLVGYALYYNKYSTWRGKAMLLEDLYCSPEYRKKKVGSGLFRAVAKEAVCTGCQQMDFEVLAWNPAGQFYKKHGALDITESDSWHFYRLTREALEALDGADN